MTKTVSYRRSDVAGPPDGEAWIWHTITLKCSQAWRGKSDSLAKLLEFLEIEHMRHGGMENGNIIAPYADLVRFGIRRESIPGTVKEGEQRGLIAAERRGRHFGTGKRLPTRYRLTYFATRRVLSNGAIEWLAPSNEWRRFRPEKPAQKIQNPVPETAPHRYRNRY